jgi:hypothetical protein
LSLLVFQSTDGAGKPSPQLIYSFSERSNVVCQVQGPGFIRLASRVETLISQPPGGFNIDRNSGIVVFPWWGQLWGIAGGQQAAGLPLRVTANFESSPAVDKTIVPDGLHQPLYKPEGFVELPLGGYDDESIDQGVHKAIDSEESFSDSVLTYDLGGILKRIFHPCLITLLIVRSVFGQTTNGVDVPIDVRSKNFTIARSISLTSTIGFSFNNNFTFINPDSQAPGMCIYITNDSGNGASHNVGLGIFLTNNEIPLGVVANGTNQWRATNVWHGFSVLASGTATIAVGQTDAFFAETQGSLFIAVSPSTSGSGDTFSITGAMVNGGNCGIGNQVGGPVITHAPATVNGMMRAVNPGIGQIDPLTGGVTTAANPPTSLPVLFVQPVTSANAGSLANPVIPAGNNGIQLVEKGPRWIVTNTGMGVAADAQRAAGGVGIRHVLDCLFYSGASTGATAAATIGFQVKDGASVLLSNATAHVACAAAGCQTLATFGLCGLQIIGTANSTMDVLFAAGVANENQSVTMTGFDIQ